MNRKAAFGLFLVLCLTRIAAYAQIATLSHQSLHSATTPKAVA